MLLHRVGNCYVSFNPSVNYLCHLPLKDFLRYNEALQGPSLTLTLHIASETTEEQGYSQVSGCRANHQLIQTTDALVEISFFLQ